MKLKDILRDQEKGSGELLRNAVAWLEKHPDALDEAHLAFTLALLRKSRPSMAGFSVMADRIEHDLAQTLALLPRVLLHDISRGMTRADREAARHFADVLRARGAGAAVSLSWSTSVLRGLRAAGELVTSLHVLQSNPGGEGERLVEAAGDFLDEVILVPDEDLENAVRKADFGLIGADTVFADGAVLNKVLSAKLGEALRSQKKPLFVLATTWKRSAANSAAYQADPHDRGLFEVVAPDLITEIITEAPRGGG